MHNEYESALIHALNAIAELVEDNKRLRAELNARPTASILGSDYTPIPGEPIPGSREVTDR